MEGGRESFTQLQGRGRVGMLSAAGQEVRREVLTHFLFLLLGWQNSSPCLWNSHPSLPLSFLHPRSGLQLFLTGVWATCKTRSDERNILLKYPQSCREVLKLADFRARRTKTLPIKTKTLCLTSSLRLPSIKTRIGWVLMSMSYRGCRPRGHSAGVRSETQLCCSRPRRKHQLKTKFPLTL